MRIPEKISPCPIVDATVEIRFTSNVPSEAVFGLLYNSIKNDFKGRVEPLPILQFPPAIVASDPNLKHKPHYKMTEGEFALQLGPDVITISYSSESGRSIYPGWTTFSAKILEVFNKILESNIIGDISRLGMRYINFFKEENIFHSLNNLLNINAQSNILVEGNSLIRSEISDGEYFKIIQISNSAGASIDGLEVSGSMIDLDISISNNLHNFRTNTKVIIDTIHSLEKSLFFSLLDEKYIEKLNPEYV